jgi:hypothetical protein
MGDRLIISFGNWVTLQADGLFAIEAAVVVTAFLGVFWLAGQFIDSRNRSSDPNSKNHDCKR